MEIEYNKPKRSECLDYVNLNRITRYSKLYGTKIDQKYIDKISKDRKIFGREIKGIDLGKMSEEEYQSFINENEKKIQRLAI